MHIFQEKDTHLLGKRYASFVDKQPVLGNCSQTNSKTIYYALHGLIMLYLQRLGLRQRLHVYRISSLTTICIGYQYTAFDRAARLNSVCYCICLLANFELLLKAISHLRNKRLVFGQFDAKTLFL
jgi:hypothetical protein